MTSSALNEFSYNDAFSRNRGLIAPHEQEKLATSHIAIAGMGGIGGINLITLARLGVGRFTIADADSFEVGNFNRQYGATMSTAGRMKVDVMAEIGRDINPNAEIRVCRDPIGPRNVDAFLSDAEIFIDAVDIFALEVRRLLFRAAARNGMYGITAGPAGFSGVWIVFDPHGMTFDRYFDMSDEMAELDKLVAFVIGVAPGATHRSYMDMSKVDPASKTAPSSALACNLASGAVASECLKILLRKGVVRAAPFYSQFDPYVYKFRHGRLWGGNRNAVQRIKRRALKRMILKTQRELQE